MINGALIQRTTVGYILGITGRVDSGVDLLVLFLALGIWLVSQSLVGVTRCGGAGDTVER